ncbi:unnamed protein product [Paramecium sonneborni]|uniref:FHA domain-containing protein n=1 Tax=Paramecium sonneborni TaxID=65129 RepID=A0A8S1QXI0_9CILI|nr:unnamed protein product [Paramecium sonneborni]CAD8120421.1 unnamed protein product [Paramecium sonneborni]
MDNREFYLDVIQRPSTPYLIIQSRHKKQKKQEKAVLVISFQNAEPIKIGRGHQCDIQISDISVSRLHAYIKYQDGLLSFLIIKVNLDLQANQFNRIKLNNKKQTSKLDEQS